MSAISYLRKYVINILDLRIDQNNVEKVRKYIYKKFIFLD
jgi:hypothetical protein